VEEHDEDDDHVDASSVDLGAFIRHQREVAKMSIRRLSEIAGVSNPYLSQIERGLRRPSADILQQLARGLRISAETLYVRAGMLDPDKAPTADVAEAIGRDALLTPEQKQALLAVYQGFIASRVESTGPGNG
jgi:transcriptional regulator with XRE-family HTH domain